MRGREAHVFIAAGALQDGVTNTATEGVVVGGQRSLGGGIVLGLRK